MIQGKSTVKSVPQRKPVTTTKISNTSVGMVYTPPDCAMHYMGALCNPFDANNGACVPADLFPLPSQKTKTFVRGTFALGTTGYGFISANPLGTNDNAILGCTQATSVGGGATSLAAYTNTVGHFMAQLPFSSADYASGNVQYRLVAAGIRVKYVGKLLDRNGVVISFEDPDHQNVNLSSFDQISANPRSELLRVGDRQWDHAVCYSGPVTPSEVEFIGNNYYTPGQTPMVILARGLPGDVYEFEYYQHTEFIGSIAVSKSKSHADGPSFGKALEAVKNATEAKPLKPSLLSTVWDKFKAAMSKSLPQIAEMAGGAAMMLARNPAGGRMIMHGGASLVGKLLNGGTDEHNKVRMLTAPIVEEVP